MRDFAQRAEAIDEAGLDEQQRITRAVLVSDATARADLAEPRLAELAADPIFGVQVAMPILMGMLALPDADVAEALVDKLRGLGRFYGELAERQREGVAHGRLPGRVRGAPTPSPSSTACCPRRSPTTRCSRPRRLPPGSTSTAGRPGCAR